MGLFSGMFGWLRSGSRDDAQHSRMLSIPPGSQFPPSQFPPSQRGGLGPSSSKSNSGTPSNPHSVRKDLLRLVLRETLTRNGIPLGWIGADALRATYRGRDPGVHVRFLIRHWDPRLVQAAPSLEDNFQKRLLAMDPMASQWLMGFSWQFAFEDKSVCPPLPHPGSWTAQPAETAPSPLATRPGALTGNADVIAGPVRISGREQAALDEQLAESMAEAAREATKRSFASTVPLKL